MGGFPASARGLESLPCIPPGGEALGTFFVGGLSLRGGMALDFSGKLTEGKGTFWFLVNADIVLFRRVLKTSIPLTEKQFSEKIM